MTRTSIDLEDLSHQSAPIPLACKLGPILVTSGIGGKDRRTGTLPADVGEQASNCFANLEAVLVEAGLAMDRVVKVTVHLADEVHRSAVNGPWLRHFPDPASRPARHALVGDLRGGMLVQIEALAVAGDV